MRKALCSVFRFLLDIFKQIVNVIAEALIALGTAVVDVLSEVASAVSDGLFSSPVGIILVGVLGFAAFKWLAPPAGSDEVKERIINGGVSV